MTPLKSIAPPSLGEIRLAAQRLAPYIDCTPVYRCTNDRDGLFRLGTEIWVKLELFQRTGSFKPRGSLNVALNLSEECVARGFTTFSSGNHASAVAYAARVLGTTAKVVMVSSANPARVQNCQNYGGEIVFARNGAEAAQMVERIVRDEGREFIHPYEGLQTTCGTATLALELHEQIPDLDVAVVAVGGGGLCSGVAAGLKQLRPSCEVIAIEPEGADTMYRSFQSGRLESLAKVATIADSLAPPYATPYSTEICRRFVDDLVLISDDQIRAGMAYLFRRLKLIVEPAGAAAMGAVLHSLRDRLTGKRVAVVICGSNIDLATFNRHLKKHESAALEHASIA